MKASSLCPLWVQCLCLLTFFNPSLLLFSHPLTQTLSAPPSTLHYLGSPTFLLPPSAAFSLTLSPCLSCLHVVCMCQLVHVLPASESCVLTPNGFLKTCGRRSQPSHIPSSSVMVLMPWQICFFYGIYSHVAVCWI